MNTQTQEQINLDKIIESCNLAYEAEFVPFSRSRNKNEKYKSLNWIVKLAKSFPDSLDRKQSNWIITTDYTQGIGHLPKDSGYYKEKLAYEKRLHEEFGAEKGKYSKITVHSPIALEYKAATIPAPSLKDVLYSLCIDSDVLDNDSFESWAGDFGYETDSRKAEKIYNDCLGLALKLRNLIGEAKLAELKEAFTDY